MAIRLLADVIKERLAALEAGEESPYEQAFRRGYHHAFEAAIRHVRDGATLDELCRHGDRVEAWRESFGDPDRDTYDPPAFAREG